MCNLACLKNAKTGTRYYLCKCDPHYVYILIRTAFTRQKMCVTHTSLSDHPWTIGAFHICLFPSCYSPSLPPHRQATHPHPTHPPNPDRLPIPANPDLLTHLPLPATPHQQTRIYLSQQIPIYPSQQTLIYLSQQPPIPPVQQTPSTSSSKPYPKSRSLYPPRSPYSSPLSLYLSTPPNVSPTNPSLSPRLTCKIYITIVHICTL